MRIKDINSDFIFWGTLWGLSEIFVWQLMSLLHFSMKAPVMAAIAILFMAAASENRPLKAIYTALVAISIKVLAGVYFFCSVWAVLSLAISWEIFRPLAIRIKRFEAVLYALSAPLGMLFFILYRKPEPFAILMYAGLNGAIAFLLSIPAFYAGRWLGSRFRPAPTTVASLYGIAAVIVIFYGWILKG